MPVLLGQSGAAEQEGLPCTASWPERLRRSIQRPQQNAPSGTFKEDLARAFCSMGNRRCGLG